MPEAPGRTRLVGVASIRSALERGERVGVALVHEERASPEVRALVTRLEASGSRIRFEPARAMRRMSSGDAEDEIIALLGPPPADDVDELLSRPGLALVLVGLRYPGNVGFILRSAEVAGAAGVVLCHDWSNDELSEARRVSIRADRFLSCAETSSADAVASVRASGRRLVALETSGDRTPWAVDWSAPTALFVGSERHGLPASVLEHADAIVRVPTRGFIPSYNVQAAVGIAIGEYLRQTSGSVAASPV